MSDNSVAPLSLDVKEVRRGLFRIRWEIDDVRDPLKATFHLCGSQSDRSYIIACYPKQRERPYQGRKERPPYEVRLTLKKTPHNPRYNDCVEWTGQTSALQEQQPCEVSEDNPSSENNQPSDLNSLKPIYVWVSVENLGKEDQFQFEESIDSGTWRLKSFFVWKQPDTINVWIDFGTWTQGEKNIMNGFAQLFTNQIQCDVQFQFPSEKSVGSHVSVLSAGSPVFAAMFQAGRFEEATTRKVTIEDVEMDVFTQLLTYLYTGNAPELNNEQITQPLFEAADKYGVETLKRECVDVMLTRLTVNNAIDMLVWSHLHSIPKLYEATMNFVAAHGNQLCFLPEWMDLMKNYPDLCFSATQRIVRQLQEEIDYKDYEME